MKKIISLVLILAILVFTSVALVSCDHYEEKGNSEDTNPPQGTTNPDTNDSGTNKDIVNEDALD